MSWEQNVQIATVAVAALTAILATVTAVLLSVVQSRSARSAWRRDQLADKYTALRRALFDMQSFLVTEIPAAYKGKPPGIDNPLAERLDEVHGAVIREAIDVFVVADHEVIRLLPVVLQTPRAPFLPFGVDGVSSTVYAEFSAELELLTKTATLVAIAMRIDLGVATRQERKRYREDPGVSGLREARKVRDERFKSMSEEELTRYLMNMGVKPYPWTADPKLDNLYVEPSAGGQVPWSGVTVS